ncbi:MAG TPA: VIT domain-containing protein [Candidatus Didemnitutus sp.]|nr:VIT domain-containing protein [Candidatus Didemnitutus sp.]
MNILLSILARPLRRSPIALRARNGALFLGLILGGLDAAPSETAGTYARGTCYTFAADGRVQALPLESTVVLMDVIPGLIETEIVQTFTNPTTVALEAQYAFPLPSGATITDYDLRYADHVVTSVVREKNAAAADYAAARAAGRKAALVEARDATLFSTSVANFRPGESVQVTIRFIEPLRFSQDAIDVRFPMTTGQKYFPGDVAPGTPGNAAPNRPQVETSASVPLPTYAFDLNIDGFPIQSIASPSHRIKDEATAAGGHHVTLADVLTVPDRDFVVHVDLAAAKQARSFVVTQKTASGLYGQLAIFPPASARRSAGAVNGRDVLFLIDHSGSMQGSRIANVRVGVTACLASLAPDDRFQIVVFDSDFSFYRQEWTSASASELAAATEFIANLQANSGTEMQAALSACFDFIARQGGGGRDTDIIFLTDGDVGNEATLFRLIDRQVGHTRLFTMGIGDAPNMHLIDRMAELGHGQSRFVPDNGAAAQVLADLFATLDSAVLSDVHLALLDGAGHPIEVELQPAHPGDVFAGRPLQVMFNASGTLPAAVRLDAVAEGQPVHYVLPVDAPPLRGDGLEKRWGSAVYRSLEDERMRLAPNASRTEINQRMLQAALRYQLVTELTSRVAIDQPISRSPGDPLTFCSVPQIRPADQTAGAHAADGSDSITLDPFTVEAAEDEGYICGDTLAGTRVRTTLQFLSGRIITKQFIQDSAAWTSEDLLPYFGEPLEYSLRAGAPGAEHARLNGLPLAAPVDLGTVERLTWSDTNLVGSSIEQVQPSPINSGEFSMQFGSDGQKRATLQARLHPEQNDSLLVNLGAADLGHTQTSALVGWRHDFGDDRLSFEAQDRSLEGYGRFTQANFSFQENTSEKISWYATVAAQEANRSNPTQFASNSVTSRYDGLGLFNLDLLTADLRRWTDLVADLTVGRELGSLNDQFVWLRATAHRQTLEAPIPLAPTDLSVRHDSIDLTATWNGRFADDRLRLAFLGGTSALSDRGTIGAPSSLHFVTTNVEWALGNGLVALADWQEQTSALTIPSGSFVAQGGVFENVALPRENRRRLDAGLQFSSADGQLVATVDLFSETTDDFVYRDWGWEAAHASAVPVGTGQIRLPFSYGSWPRAEREGWSGSIEWRPTSSLDVSTTWYVDWRDRGPYHGGNRRASLIARYEFKSGALNHGFVGSALAARNTLAFDDSLKIQGATRWDLFLGWRPRLLRDRRMTIQLNFVNLNDAPWQPTRFSTLRGRSTVLSFRQEF